MKIAFPDRSYIEVLQLATGKIVITVAARDSKEPLTSIVNSVELTVEQALALFQHIGSDGYQISRSN